MIDDNSIKPIIANGGWCEVNYESAKPLTEQLNGRINFSAVDYLLIDRFNLPLETLDGFYLFFRPNIKKLKKGYWVKQYLTVGGKLIQHNETPKKFVCESWLDLLRKLK